MSPLRHASNARSGFTLTENLMAMTIIIVVAVPLVGLLGMAANARDGADHRRGAALLARQIASEVALSTAGLGVEPQRAMPLIAVKPVTGRPDDWPYLDDLPGELAGLAIHVGYGADFQPTGEISDGDYENGEGGPGAGGGPLFAVRIAFERVEDAVNGAGPSARARVYRATVTVGSPAEAPAKSRRTETFTTLIQN